MDSCRSAAAVGVYRQRHGGKSGNIRALFVRLFVLHRKDDCGLRIWSEGRLIVPIVTLSNMERGTAHSAYCYVA